MSTTSKTLIYLFILIVSIILSMQLKLNLKSESSILIRNQLSTGNRLNENTKVKDMSVNLDKDFNNEISNLELRDYEYLNEK